MGATRKGLPAAPRFGVSKSRVSAVDAARLKKLLGALIEETDAKCAILIETTGALLARIGSPGQIQLHTIATLAASQLGVAQAIGKAFGGEFTIMLHQGRKDNLHLTLVGRKKLLAVLFAGDAAVGTVISASRKAAGRIDLVLKSAAKVSSRPAPTPRKTTKFGKLGGSKIGRDFVDEAKSRLDDLLQ
jgi:predicted regulator of Ras-like GTPase activity (Roadblock/LC7/MglB family)